MRTRLLALAAVATAALCAGVSGAAARSAPGSSYRWQQPGAAPVHNPGALMPNLWTAPSPDYAAGASYVWVQPGTAPPHGKAPSPY